MKKKKFLCLSRLIFCIIEVSRCELVVIAIKLKIKVKVESIIACLKI